MWQTDICIAKDRESLGRQASLPFVAVPRPRHHGRKPIAWQSALKFKEKSWKEEFRRGRRDLSQHKEASLECAQFP